MTVGIVSGRGSGRDQLGRGNAAPGLGYVADSQIVLGFPVRSQAWLGTGRFPNLLAGFDFHSGRTSKRDPITNRYNPQVRLMGISGFVLSCGEIRDGT